MLIHYIRDQWLKVRDKVAADDTGTIGVNNADWANRPVARGCRIPQGANKVVLALIGDHASDPDGLTVDLTVWGYAKEGPAHYLHSATWTIGNTKVVREPFYKGVVSAIEKYADTISAETERWLENAVAVNSGNNQIAMLVIDVRFLDFLAVEVTSLDEGLSVIPIVNYY